MYRKNSFYRVIFAIVACLCCAPLHAEQFHVTVGSDSKSAGSKITVPIVVTAEAAVGAAQLELLYDPARLQWVSGDPGKLTANTLIDANVLEPGRVKIAFAGGEDVRGTGTIYQAVFEWKGTQAGATRIRFAGVRAWDQASGLELTTSSSPGEAVPAVAAPVSEGKTEQVTSPQAGAGPNYILYGIIAVVVLIVVLAMAAVLRKGGRTGS